MDWDRVARAVELRDAGKPEQALREFRALVNEYASREEQVGDVATVALNEINCLLDLKRFKDAEKRFADIQKMPSSDLSAAGADLVYAEILLEEERHKEAAVAVDGALVKHATLLNDPEASWIKGKLLSIKGYALANLGKVDQAIAVLEQACGSFDLLSPEAYAAVHLWLGLCLLRTGQKDDGERELRLALQDAANDTLALAHYSLGTLYYERGGFAAALQHFHEVEKRLATFAWSHSELFKLLAKSYAAVGDPKESRRYEKRAKHAGHKP